MFSIKKAEVNVLIIDYTPTYLNLLTYSVVNFIIESIVKL